MDKRRLTINYPKVHDYVTKYDNLVLARLGGCINKERQSYYDKILNELWASMTEEERELASQGAKNNES